VTPSLHGPLPREIARVLAHLPERVRIVWQDHQLYGTELPVHGWHRIHGEIHLLLTLPDGSRGYFPAAGTALFDGQQPDRPAVILTADGVRQLRQLVEAFRARSRRRQRSAGRKSK
jgi:hypothetical protein